MWCGLDSPSFLLPRGAGLAFPLHTPELGLCTVTRHSLHSLLGNSSSYQILNANNFFSSSFFNVCVDFLKEKQKAHLYLFFLKICHNEVEENTSIMDRGR